MPLHLVFPLLRVAGGSPSGLGLVLAHHPPRLSGSDSSTRKPSLIPTPLPKSELDPSPRASNHILGFRSHSTCHVQSQMPLLHARSPFLSLSRLWGEDCTSQCRVDLGCFRMQGLQLRRFSGMLFQEFPCMQTGQGQARLSLAFRVRGSVGQK